MGARNEEKLQDVQNDIKAIGGLVTIQKTDVTKVSDMQNLTQAGINRFGEIDVWINDAGVMLPSDYIDGKIKDWNEMIDINIKGVLNGIYSSLETFRSQGSGQYINMASVLGIQPTPDNGVYGATKAAVRAISDSLRSEEAKAESGVRVTVVSPGAIDTSLNTHITDAKSKKNMEAYYAAHAVSPERIAGVILQAIDMPKDAGIDEVVVRPATQI